VHRVQPRTSRCTRRRPHYCFSGYSASPAAAAGELFVRPQEGARQMQLRPELTPPPLEAALVTRLSHLAANLDGAAPGQWEDDLAEFNRLAGTVMPFEQFQGIYGGEDHEDFVRRVLYQQRLAPDPALTRAEMTEIVSRVMASAADHNFYL